jgi:hypothetical protein
MSAYLPVLSEPREPSSNAAYAVLIVYDYSAAIRLILWSAKNTLPSPSFRLTVE